MKSEWTGPYRGGCLVTMISAEIAVSKSYTSSGTSYSEFAVIASNGGVYEVIRL
jgi:hypothetical protein